MTADGLARRATRSGRLVLTLSASHAVSWVLWLSGVRIGLRLAVPEYVGALAFAAWVLAPAPPAPLRSVAATEASRPQV